MSIDMIDTEYKPQFGLGAVYSGMNAGNAQNDNDARLQELFLKNQQSEQMNPMLLDKQRYENMVNEYEGNLARAKQNSPDYVPWQLQGQIGQMKTQDAAGNAAQQTWQGKANLENSQNAGNLIGSTLQNQLLGLKQKMVNDGTSPGTIGFPTTQQPQQPVSPPGQPPGNVAPTDASWKIDPNTQLNRDKLAMLTMLKEAESNPNDPALQQNIMYLKRQMDKEKAQIGQQPDTSIPTPAIQGMPNQGTQVAMNNTPPSDVNQYELLQKLLGDTPDQRNKAAIASIRPAAMVESASIRAQAQLEGIKDKLAATQDKVPKTYLETIQKYLQKEASGQELTPSEQRAKMEAQQGYDALLQSHFQPGITPQVGAGGAVSIVNKTPPPSVRKPVVSDETRVIGGQLYERVDGGWQRKQ